LNFDWRVCLAILIIGLLGANLVIPRLEAKRDFLHQDDPIPEELRNPSPTPTPTATPSPEENEQAYEQEEEELAEQYSRFGTPNTTNEPPSEPPPETETPTQTPSSTPTQTPEIGQPNPFAGKIFKVYCPPPVYKLALEIDGEKWIVSEPKYISSDIIRRRIERNPSRYYVLGSWYVSKIAKISTLTSGWKKDWTKTASDEVWCWTGTMWERFGGSFNKGYLDEIALSTYEVPQGTPGSEYEGTLYKWKLPPGIEVTKYTKWIPAGSNNYEVWIKVEVNGHVVATGPNTATVDWKNGGLAVGAYSQFRMTGGGIALSSVLTEVMGQPALRIIVVVTAFLAGIVVGELREED